MPGDKSTRLASGGRPHPSPYLLGLQRSRAAVYALAVGSALVFRAAGVLDLRVAEGVLIGILGAGSAALVALLARDRARYRRWHADAAWLALDVLLVTWGVGATGGFASPWYLWYLAIAGAAAFAAGRRGALAVSLGNSAAYLAVLGLRGEIGLFDGPCLEALARMTFLHGAALFFVRGAADLSVRRLEIKRLREEDALRMADLERLAVALDQRTRELTAANARIQEADRQKSRFLANVSHELRTPLNSILGFSQVLATRFAAALPEKPARFVAHIHSSGEHLLKVLDDVLDLSKIEAGRMSLQPVPVDVAAVVADAAAAAQGEAAPRGIALRTEVPSGLPPVDADPLKLKQVLLNLVANAIHYSPDGAPVTVAAELLSAHASPLQVETLRLSVRDEGTGIAPEDQATVFDEFRQARRHAHAGGTGLGLALVKSLVALHGGAVGLSSVPGHGSTFRVDVPVRFRGSREAAPSDSSSGNVPAFAPPRVLVVGESGTEPLRGALEDAGCLALTARAGPDAFRLTHTLHPAALALALDGPRAWELVHRLKGDADTRTIPVVLWSIPPGTDRGAALAADELVLGPVTVEPDGDAGGDGSGRVLVWARSATLPGAEDALLVGTLEGARAAGAEHPLRSAVLDLAADPAVVAFAGELSRTSAATGAPRLRLHVPHPDSEAGITERLAAMAASGGDAPAALASLVMAVSLRGLARAASAR